VSGGIRSYRNGGDAYGSAYVYEKKAPIGAFTNPYFEVRMEPDTVDSIGWAICSAVVTSTLQHGSKEDAEENTNDLISDVVTKVREGVHRATPVISSVPPPWLSVKAKPTKIVERPEDLMVEIRLEFQTGINVGGI
jgi:hypothetical protein